MTDDSTKTTTTAADKRGRGVTRPRQTTPTPGARDSLNHATMGCAGVTPLLSGIDSLYLFSKLNLSQSFAEELRELKTRAVEQRSQGAVKLGIGDFEVTVQPNSARTAEFLLTGEHIALRLNDTNDRRTAMGFPAVAVELRSLYLWNAGAAKAVDQVSKLLRPFLFLPTGVTTVEFGVSRLDLTCDFQGWVPEGNETFTSRARKRATYRNGNAVTGFTFGKTPVGARLYDKTEEIRTNVEKQWFEDLWRESSDFEPSRPVWRLEFQFSREFLNDLQPQLGAWEAVPARTRALWRQMTGEWLTLRQGRNASGRGELTKAWRSLRDDAFATGIWGGTNENLYRCKRRRIGLKHEAQITGDVVRVMAGHRFASNETAPTLRNATEQLVERVAGYCARTGKTLESRIEAKVEEFVRAGAVTSKQDDSDVSGGEKP
jgi:hypothetical protein